jgi:hypothetical protein
MNDDVRVTATRINDHVEIVHDDRPDVVLEVPRHDWQRFTEAMKAGAFDLDALPRKSTENVA